jgi:hypothetical protein
MSESMSESMPESAALPPAAPAALSFRQKLAREAWGALAAGGAAALAQVGRARRAPAAAARRGAGLLQRLGAAEPARALALVGRARRLGARPAFLAQAEAILTARARGWAAAAPLFLAPAARRVPGAAAALLRGRPAPAAELALPARERPAAPDPETAAGLVVYTTAFGDEPDPAPVFAPLPGLRFLCLADRPLEVAGWEALPPPAGAPADPARAAAWCRIRPDLALAAAAPAARASLYLRADRWLVGNLATLLLRWCLPHELALWRHPQGVDWQDLAEARLIGAPPPDVAASVIAQAQDCAARGFPRDRGAWDTGLIWRRHTPGVAALMADWWAEAEAAPDGIEETALYAALHGRGERPGAPAVASVTPRLLPAALGAADDNAFAAARPPAPPPRARGCPGGWKVAVVYAEKYAASASTYLRGRQLAELVAERDAALADTLYTSDLDALRDRVVVLTKGALEVHSAETIAAAARRNVAVVGSWDDMLPEPDKVAATSASMTLSHRQTVDFARAFPDRPAFHVTHHVNRQIRPCVPPMDRPRAGYFGLLRNTHCPASLGSLVDLVGISTATVEMSWLDALPRYNCHWIVRRKAKAHDGWKPFLKGFVAARCNAVVVTGRDDDDALQYLGDDYPFYVRGTDAATLEMDMMEIAAAFGGPDWARALEIMAQVGARSSDAIVVAEFRAMVRALAG